MNIELNGIARFREQAGKCIRCGLCLHSCPVYAEELDENYAARGKNRLLVETLDDYRELIAGVQDRFSKCLLCGRCTMVCPQGIRTDQLTVAARSELVKGVGLPFAKRMVFRRLMRDANRFKRAVRTVSRLQRLLPATEMRMRKIRRVLLEDEPLYDEKMNKIYRMPSFFAGLGGGRRFPSVAERFLSEQMPEINAPAVGAVRQKIRVAFFSGCAQEFVFPETGKALVRILNQLGVEVLFPGDQCCCGLPAAASGDLETAREMALYNLGVFSELDPDIIVNSCATCGSTLKDGWANLVARNKDERARFEDFGARVRDISELLIELAGFKPPRYRSLLPEGTRVTYHDPCHLARHQRITEQPRKILRQVFRDNFVEMDDNGCCGMGGAFSIEHSGLSKKIAGSKVASLAKTNTDVVLTACPGCIIQLIDAVTQNGLPHAVAHILDVIEPIPVMEDAFTYAGMRGETKV